MFREQPWRTTLDTMELDDVCRRVQEVRGFFASMPKRFTAYDLWLTNYPSKLSRACEEERRRVFRLIREIEAVIAIGIYNGKIRIATQKGDKEPYFEVIDNTPCDWVMIPEDSPFVIM